MQIPGKRIWLVTMLALAALESPVRAESVQTFSQTVGLSPVNYQSPVLVTIPQFNPATGTLLFVTVRITANYEASVLAENNSNTPANITVAASETVTVTPPIFVYVLPITGTAFIPVTTLGVAATDGIGPFSGPDTAVFSLSPNPQSQLLASLMYNNIDAGFPNFIGNGNLPDFAVNGLGQFFVSSNTGVVNAKANLSAGATIEVEYHYVPEPATILPLLAGLLVWRRRRR